jgi:branched-chain amino acid transport system ATP-binding protein
LAPPESTLLEVDRVEAGYGKKRVLGGVDLHVGAGEAIALIGHNGAGKTTLLRTIVALQPLWRGQVCFAGRAPRSARDAVRRGMALIPAERFVFPDLTVLDNLRLSARRLPRGERAARLHEAYDMFPVLEGRRDQLAGTMSGGEQRMVSLAMALIPRPRLLLLDEPSLGLSPAIAEQIMARVRSLVSEGTSVVLVEQNVASALALASRVYVLRSGAVIHEESSDGLLAKGREQWWELF